MATKIENLIREEFMENVREFFKERGEEVLQVKSGTLCIPWARDDDEGYINISFVIPKGERDKENKTYIPYDGYSEAENYEMETEAKRAKKAETEKLPERCIGQFASGKIVLIAHIIHSKQHRWQQGYHHKAHDAFGVDGIMDACSACRGLVRNVQERVEAVVDALEGVQFSVRFKLRLDFIKIISE